MKLIRLTKGMVAIVDDADYEFLSQWKWCAHKCKDRYYAARNVPPKSSQKCMLMHVQIMNTPRGMWTDHKNGNGLDNRRDNLRIVTPPQNLANARKWNTNTSGFKGVSRIRNKWRAYIGDNKSGTWKHLGHYDIPEDAARAYDVEAIARYGEFARTNASLGAFS